MTDNDRTLSRRSCLKMTLGAATAMCAGRVLSAWGGTPSDAERGGVSQPVFQNPLFAGEHPDPSIFRVGEDFYITHTSYSFTPGLVVWHSRDLVNWMPISHAIDKAVNEVWAPDLVFHDGRYFIYFPMGGIFVVHAEHPSGPWSEPISLHLNSIDPGHVVGPDGRRYLYTAGGGAIELSADGLSTIGAKMRLYEGWPFPAEWKTEGKWLESPKLCRRGDYYYLICAEGGTSGPPTSHMAIVARSQSPLGPWENSPTNPLIHTYSADEAWWSVGHGTLISTPDDRWYFVYHGYRKGLETLGRQTLMEPIEWTSDGWPRAPLGAHRGEPMPAPMGVAQRPMIELSDDFQATELKATWEAWKEPDRSRFKTGQGTLVMHAKGKSYADSPSLTIKARDESYAVQVVAEADAENSAALGLEYDAKAAIFVELKDASVNVVGPKGLLASRDWPGKSVWLKLKNQKNNVELYASENGRDWQSLIKDFDVSHFDHNSQHRGFQAARPALAAIGSGEVRFRAFEYMRL